MYVAVPVAPGVHITSVVPVGLVTPTHELTPVSTRLTVLVGGVTLVQLEYVVPDGYLGQGDCPLSASNAVRVPLAVWLHTVASGSVDGADTVPVCVFE